MATKSDRRKPATAARSGIPTAPDPLLLGSLPPQGTPTDFLGGSYGDQPIAAAYEAGRDCIQAMRSVLVIARGAAQHPDPGAVVITRHCKVDELPPHGTVVRGRSRILSRPETQEEVLRIYRRIGGDLADALALLVEQVIVLRPLVGEVRHQAEQVQAATRRHVRIWDIATIDVLTAVLLLALKVTGAAGGPEVTNAYHYMDKRKPPKDLRKRIAAALGKTPIEVIRECWSQIPEMDLDDLELQLCKERIRVESTHESPPPRPPRLVVHENERTVTLDEETFPMTKRQMQAFTEIRDGVGQWVSGRGRIDRVVASLALPLQALIKSRSGHGGGFRMEPALWREARAKGAG